VSPVDGPCGAPGHHQQQLPEDKQEAASSQTAAMTTPAPTCGAGGRAQMWTVSGYPVVDGKYLDLAGGGEVRNVAPGDYFRFGPPAVDIYWHNQRPPADDEARPFIAARYPYQGTATEYLVRAARFWAKGGCDVVSMSVSQYAVYVVVATEMTMDEVKDGMHVALYGPSGEGG
jgi:hypothetical protein